jgi:hypothetical protein
MKLSQIIGPILVFIVFQSAFAQPPAIEWSRTYGGPNRDDCYDLEITADGGFVLAGGTRSYGFHDGDFWIIKTNADGDSLWSRTFGGSGWEVCYCIRQTADTGIIAVGERLSFVTSEFSSMIVKMRSNGDSLWSRSYDIPGDDGINAICQTPDGGYLVGGYAWYNSSGNQALIMKLNANGDSIWSRAYGGENGSTILAICPIEEGGYLLAGTTYPNTTSSWVFWFFKINESGDTLWCRSYEQQHSSSKCFSAYQTSDGGFILGGLLVTDTVDTDNVSCWMVKTDANGDSLWSRTFGSSGFSAILSVQQTTAGDYIFTGCKRTSGTDVDLWVVKTDEDGNVSWDYLLSGTNDDCGNSVRQTSDGGFMVGGVTASFGAGSDDFLLIKIAPDMSVPYASVPQKMCFLTNYPNPFNSSTQIEYTLPTTRQVSLRLYDVLGREVAVLVNGIKTAGEYRVTFDAAGLASGVYLCRIEAGEFAQTRKIVLLR